MYQYYKIVNKYKDKDLEIFNIINKLKNKLFVYKNKNKYINKEIDLVEFLNINETKKIEHELINEISKLIDTKNHRKYIFYIINMIILSVETRSKKVYAYIFNSNNNQIKDIIKKYITQILNISKDYEFIFLNNNKVNINNIFYIKYVGKIYEFCIQDLITDVIKSNHNISIWKEIEKI